jgi:urate oxidase|tara:strand:+ start:363 stop:599 length:237 start_codon:yes stop_codon:yes gene_type:complete
MDQQITHSFTLSLDDRRVEISCGQFQAYDDSNRVVSVYVGTDALNAGVEKYLQECDRSTQERFIQIINDHIRKTEGEA